MKLAETILKPALEGSKTQIEDKDKVFIKKIWKSPVPNHYEVQKLLSFLDDTEPVKICLYLILVTGARPVEVVRLRWTDFEFDEDNSRFMYLYHYTYKPTNRIAKSSKNVYYKEVKKKIWSLSPKLSDLLLHYFQEAPNYEHDKLFPWSNTDSLNQFFTRLRKELKKNGHCYNHELDFIFDECTEQICGPADRTKHRICPYSLRRFSISFMYWSKQPGGFNQDIIALSKYVGHTRPDTTQSYYVMPKESIGLNEEMIEQGISLDQFIGLVSANQTLLSDFTKKKNPFIPFGQKRIGNL